MKTRKILKEVYRMVLDLHTDEYNRGWRAALEHIEGYREQMDSEGYERGFKDGYDIGHGVASGTLPQPNVDVQAPIEGPVDLTWQDGCALSAEDLRFSDDVDHDAGC